MGIRKVLVVFNKSPYGNVAIVEGIRLATGITAADIESSVLFVGDAVFALLDGQQPDSIGLPSIGGSLEFLTSNGIQIHILKESLISRGITETHLQPMENLKIITLAEMSNFLPQFDAVFSI